MKRYYICPIVVEVDPEMGTMYIPKIAKYGVTASYEIRTVNGIPTTNWALCIVDAQNHGKLISDSEIDPMPDFPMDGKVSAIQTNVRNAMINRLQARGIDTSFIGNADGYRDVIRGIGRVINPNFDENNFDANT